MYCTRSVCVHSFLACRRSRASTPSRKAVKVVARKKEGCLQLALCNGISFWEVLFFFWPVLPNYGTDLSQWVHILTRQESARARESGSHVGPVHCSHMGAGALLMQGPCGACILFRWDPRGTHVLFTWEPHGPHMNSMWAPRGTNILFNWGRA